MPRTSHQKNMGWREFSFKWAVVFEDRMKFTLKWGEREMLKEEKEG
jgi:hypothetical protein